MSGKSNHYKQARWNFAMRVRKIEGLPNEPTVRWVSVTPNGNLKKGTHMDDMAPERHGVTFATNTFSAATDLISADNKVVGGAMLTKQKWIIQINQLAVGEDPLQPTWEMFRAFPVKLIDHETIPPGPGQKKLWPYENKGVKVTIETEYTLVEDLTYAVHLQGHENIAKTTTVERDAIQPACVQEWVERCLCDHSTAITVCDWSALTPESDLGICDYPLSD
eukprot:TRINITY_DN48262_c0_g1_i2.p1 TRINITY_DN48262_c0_g1~~TRINITY_DN48262_c0_g1_i2.p1  ORF type:complete len:221 (+),score=10.11 TRINITY_DN48262_c0_g1_i2:103-765(+)